MHLFCCIHYDTDVLPVDLGGISGDVKYRYDMDFGFLLVVLHGDQLVDSCFDAIIILGCGCSC